jgi:SAM-dependent methyltransferase
MNHLLRGVVRALVETFSLPGPVLEIGSRRVEGQENLADVRPWFSDQDYQGIDLSPGPGVDCVADVERLPHLDSSVGTVLALNAFEHVRRFWLGFEEIHRVLKPGGALVVTCPFYFRMHNYPEDYWRFSPSALEVLLEKYPSAVLGWHGPRNRPAHVWALAFKEGRPPIHEAEFNRYRTLLAQYAREPASLRRTLMGKLGQIFHGHATFAPYLDRNRVETTCRNHYPPSSTKFSKAEPGAPAVRAAG